MNPKNSPAFQIPRKRARTRSVRKASKEPPPDGEAPIQGEGSPPPAAQPSSGSGSGTVLSIPSHQMAEIKRREREKGAKAALQEAAKAAGFETYEKMVEASKQRTDRREDQGRPRGDREGGEAAALRSENNKLKKMLSELEGKNAALASEKAKWEKQARRARSDLKDAGTEMEIRTEALRAGVTDPDYAVQLVRKHIKGKSDAELQSFDASKFFDGLKESKPHLFAIVEMPANTGPGGKQEQAQAGEPGSPAPKPKAPPAPKPGKQEQAQAQEQLPDARKMTRQEYQEHLKKHGLHDPSSMT